MGSLEGLLLGLLLETLDELGPPGRRILVGF